jgi:hypothetical protein
MVTAMEDQREGGDARPPEDDPGASTEQFRAFAREDFDEAARRGAPRFPAGVVALLAIVGVVIVLALVLMRG